MNKNYTCDLCAEKHNNGFDISGASICENCYEEETMVCTVCGHRALLPASTESTFIGENFVCSRRCAREHPDNSGGRIIWSTPRFNYFLTNKKNLLNTHNFTVGVEIECLSNEDSPRTLNAAYSLSSSDVNIIRSRCVSESDASLRGGFDAYEFITNPTSNDETYKTITALTNFLENNSFRTNDSCGLHIHIGENNHKRLNNINRHKIYIIYAIYKKLLFKLVKNREDNEYCDHPNYYLQHWFFLKGMQKEPEEIINDYIDDRYCHINAQAWHKHQTIELRLHHGTINKEEIINWIKLNTKIFNWVCKTRYNKLLNLTGTFIEFRNLFLNDDEELKAFYTKRYKNAKNKKAIAVELKREKRELKEDAKRHMRDAYSTSNISNTVYNKYLLDLAEIKNE